MSKPNTKPSVAAAATTAAAAAATSEADKGSVTAGAETAKAVSAAPAADAAPAAPPVSDAPAAPAASETKPKGKRHVFKVKTSQPQRFRAGRRFGAEWSVIAVDDDTKAVIVADPMLTVSFDLTADEKASAV